MIVTLIGMPGSGKSCMGRALASKLKMKNIDTDKVVEKTTGKKLHEMIAEIGLEQFKSAEQSILLNINEDNAIISTGGSAVYYDSVMKRFASLGPVVYLYVSLPVLLERLGDFSKRGIAMRPDQTIEDLYNERCSLYEKYATVTVNCDGKAYSKYQRDAFTKIKIAIESLL